MLRLAQQNTKSVHSETITAFTVLVCLCSEHRFTDGYHDHLETHNLHREAARLRCLEVIMTGLPVMPRLENNDEKARY